MIIYHKTLLRFLRHIIVELSILASCNIVILAELSPHPIVLHLESSCPGSANLSWSIPTSSPFGLRDGVAERCELSYSQIGERNAQIMYLFLETESQLISLYNLTEGTSYTVFMVCGDSYRTNDITVHTDDECHNFKGKEKSSLNSTNDNENNPKVLTYDEDTSFDAFEWPIVIVFIAIGAIICIVVAYYTWKKYERRQRILRIFRHSPKNLQGRPKLAPFTLTLDNKSGPVCTLCRQDSSDPFQALYSPSSHSDSYSV